MNRRAEARTARLSQVVVGLGSPHGDDQFGWAVIDELAKSLNHVELHKIRHPVDALAWIDHAEVLHIVDAAKGLPESAEVSRFEFADPDYRARIKSVAARGTHDVNLHAALMMALSLGKPTWRITLWLGRAEQFAPMTPMSAATQRAVVTCLKIMNPRLCDARNVAR